MPLAPTVEPESSRTETPGVPSGEVGSNASASLASDPRWQALQRLIKGESFAKAARLSSFLLYIVERTLQGRTEEITEQQIGVHVFGRPANYNAGEDNIVRQTARQLRQRLALYYQEEGRGESIQIVIPRGGYTPQFQHITQPTASEPQDFTPAFVGADPGEIRDDPPSTAVVADGRRDRAPRSAVLLGLGVVFGLLLALAIGFGVDRLRHPRVEEDRLWDALFTSNQRTLVVPGDAGINMFGNLARTQVDVWQYGSGSYLSKPEAQTPAGFSWSPFASRRYTTISDLRFVSSIENLQNVNRSRMEIRFARDVSTQDLKDANAILIGSPNYDPWIELFDRNQSFRMVYDGPENTISVLNRDPRKGEQASYTWSETNPQRTGYAIVSLTDNLGSTGRVLLVEGTTMGGVDAAADFLFDAAKMAPVVRAATGHNGRLSNFELLLETTLYFGGSLKARVVSEKVHPAA